MADDLILVVPEPLYPDGDTTPFDNGERWSGGIFALTQRHIDALQKGQILILDVRGEYVVNLKFKKD